MKKAILIVCGIVNLFGWEINTHRAIDKQAANYSSNFQYFVKDSGLQNETYKNELFEGYGNYTYFSYVTNGETNGISKKYWKQTFSNYDAQDLIEAGSILEDAQWPDAFFAGDGRFNNHFYDPQKGGKGLTFGYGDRTDAITWATGEETKGERL
jgi:hypothetical protein